MRLVLLLLRVISLTSGARPAFISIRLALALRGAVAAEGGGAMPEMAAAAEVT